MNKLLYSITIVSYLYCCFYNEMTGRNKIKLMQNIFLIVLWTLEYSRLVEK